MHCLVGVRKTLVTFCQSRDSIMHQVLYVSSLSMVVQRTEGGGGGGGGWGGGGGGAEGGEDSGGCGGSR